MIERKSAFEVGYRYRAEEADGWITVVCRSPVDDICDLCIIEGVEGIFVLSDHRDFEGHGTIRVGDLVITLDEESGELSPDTLPSQNEAFLKFVIANAREAQRKIRATIDG